MKPRLIWRARRWSEGSLVREFPDIRHAYGEAIANHVELCADLLRDRRDAPALQDRRRTLLAIADSPATADLSSLDASTDAALMRASYERFGNAEALDLTPTELAEAAQIALAALPRNRRGAPQTDDIALRLTRGLLELLPAGTTVRKQKALLAAAFEVCRLGFDEKTIERLRTMAGRIR